MKIGYFLSSEETAPLELIGQARMAEDAGFDGLIAEEVTCGGDLDTHLEKIREYEEAGLDELYVGQIGEGHERMFELYSQEILPRYNGS